MVGDHDVRGLRALADAVHVALTGVEAAAALGALLSDAGDGHAVVLGAVHVERVEVVPRRLRHPRHGGGDVRERDRRLLGVREQAVEFAQAGVVLVALERHEAQRLGLGLAGGVERARERGKLPVHELVQQGVRARGHTHAHAVAQREQCRGHEVRHRLAHAGAGLHGQVRLLAERLQDRQRHLALRVARLEAGIHLAEQPVGGERRPDVATRRRDDVGLLGIGERLGLAGLARLVAEVLEVEGAGVTAAAGARRQHLAQRPRHVGRQTRDRLDKVAREDLETGHAHAPQAERGLRVVERAVRGGTEPEGLGQVRQAVRAHARQRDARELEGVEPPARQGPAARGLQERAVEVRVVPHEVGAGGERREIGGGGVRGGRAREVVVTDAGEAHDRVGKRAAGIHEGVERAHDLGAARPHRADLHQALAGGVEAGGLHVHEDELVLPQRRRLSRALRERGVCVDHSRVGARRKVGLESPVSHAPPIPRPSRY